VPNYLVPVEVDQSTDAKQRVEQPIFMKDEHGVDPTFSDGGDDEDELPVLSLPHVE